MTFHASAEEDSVRVEGSTLFGRLRDMGGNLQDAAINLDEFLGNNDGRFDWGGENFSQSAQNIRFSFEGADNVPVLRASLQNTQGEWQEADVNLAERVENIDGRFEFR